MRQTALFILYLFFGIKVFGCDCIESSLKETIPLTDLILTGTFISVENNAWPLMEGEKEEDRLFFEGKIIVTEVLIGNSYEIGDTLVVNSDYSNCSKYYKEKTEYMFFASKTESGIISDACSFTHPLDERARDKWYQETIEELKK